MKMILHFRRSPFSFPSGFPTNWPPCQTLKYSLRPYKHFSSKVYATTKPKYLRPTLFTFGTILTSFTVAVSIYDQTQLKAVQNSFSLKDLWQRKSIAAHSYKVQLIRAIARWPEYVPMDVRKAATMLVNRFYNLHDSQHTILAIMTLNTLIFALWQVPFAQAFMYKWFTHHPLSGRSITLLTSAFSHQTAFHFGANMFGLWAFGTLLHHTLGSREEFLAMYMSAGVFASYLSHIVSLRTMAHSAILPSLGASGALFACLGAVAIQRPDLQVGLLFVPGFDLSLKYAFSGMVGFDLMGVIFGWRMFDHMAHLGGSFFGLFYVSIAREMLWFGLLDKYIELKHNVKVGRFSK